MFMEFSLPKALSMPSLDFLQFFLLYVFISQVACCHTSWKVRSEPKRRDMEGRGPDCRQAPHRQEGMPGGCSPGGPASSRCSDQPRGNAHCRTSSLWFWLVSPTTAKRPGPRAQAGRASAHHSTEHPNQDPKVSQTPVNFIGSLNILSKTARK